MQQPFPANSPIYRKAPQRTRLIAILIIVALFLVGLIPKVLHNRSLAKETRRDSAAPPGVNVERPRLALADPLLLPGTLQSISNTVIQARATGYVTKYYVDIGSKVKAGQLLAEIESPDTDQQAIQASAQTLQSQATVGQNVAQVESQIAAVRQSEAAYESDRAKLAQAVAAEYQAKAVVAQKQRQVQAERAALTQARAQYQLAYTTVKRYETLLLQGFVAQQDYDQAAATYKTDAATVQSAEANVLAAQADQKASEETVLAQQALVRSAKSDADAAHANIRAAQENVRAAQGLVTANQAAVGASVANERRFAVMRNFEKVVAPFDGVITARNVDIGSLITGGTSTTTSGGSTVGPSPSATGSSGSPAATPAQAVTVPSTGLFGIARVDTVQLLVYVPQTDSGAIANNAPASVVIKEFPGVKFQGRVALQSGAIDAQSRTRLIEIYIPNRDNRLLPGMYAQAIIQPNATRRTLRVPSNTVIFGTDGTRVAVVGRDGVAHLRPITIGRDFGTEVEVMDGLRGDESLIADPTDDLRDGVKVKVLPPKKKAANGSGAGKGSGAGAGDKGGGGFQNGEQSADSQGNVVRDSTKDQGGSSGGSGASSSGASGSGTGGSGSGASGSSGGGSSGSSTGSGAGSGGSGGGSGGGGGGA